MRTCSGIHSKYSLFAFWFIFAVDYGCLPSPFRRSLLWWWELPCLCVVCWFPVLNSPFDTLALTFESTEDEVDEAWRIHSSYMLPWYLYVHDTLELSLSWCILLRLPYSGAHPSALSLTCSVMLKKIIICAYTNQNFRATITFLFLPLPARRIYMKTQAQARPILLTQGVRSWSPAHARSQVWRIGYWSRVCRWQMDLG